MWRNYGIIKSSTDGSFGVGDIIWLSENGDLNSVQGRGGYHMKNGMFLT